MAASTLHMEKRSHRFCLHNRRKGSADRVRRGRVARALRVGFFYLLPLGDRLRYPGERDFLGMADSVCTTGTYSRDGLGRRPQQKALKRAVGPAWGARRPFPLLCVGPA